MFRLVRTMAVVGFLLGVLVSCGPALFGRNVIQLKMPRSDIRDVVRDAALWANGQPLFENLDTNYAFEDGRFHIEGEYRASDGQLRHGFLELAFSVKRGELQVAIVENDVEGITDEVERINSALSTALTQKVEDTLAQEVVAYRDVEPLADNILQISLIPQIDADSKIVPLPGK